MQTVRFHRRAACVAVRLAVALLALCAGPVRAADVADGPVTLLYNARVFTAERNAPYAQAVAVRGDRILAVGSLEQVEKAAGPAARRVDLHGKFLMPGMIDAHAHPIGSPLVLGGGFSMVTPAFPDTHDSIPDLVRFIDKTLDEGTGRIGDTLFVGDIDIGYWPHAEELDAVLSNGRHAKVPIALIGSDGHTGWCNRVARERAGITAQYLRKLTAPERAYYGYGKDFAPNGFVVDVGLTRMRQSLPKPSADFMLTAGRTAVKHLNSLGITGWLDAAVAGVVGGDIPLTSDDPGSLPVYQELSRRGELTAHVAAYPVIKPEGGIGQVEIVEKLRRQFKDVPNLTVPGIKVFADGVVEIPSQTAALTRPYVNSGRTSPLLFDPQRFNALVVEADRRGLIVHIHAIGDLAVKASLDAFAAARQANPAGTLPHTLTHAQFVDPEDIPRFAQYRVIAALQLLWAVADPSTNEVVRPYIDPAIYSTMYPARSMLESGATIAGASDWPVTSANPFEAMAQAETRTGPQGVLDAGQRMPREAMLYAYTRGSAQVLDQLDQIGSLAPGKRADLIVVDRDLLTVPAAELREAKVEWTLFGGQTVFGSAP